VPPNKKKKMAPGGGGTKRAHEPATEVSPPNKGTIKLRGKGKKGADQMQPVARRRTRKRNPNSGLGSNKTIGKATLPHDIITSWGSKLRRKNKVAPNKWTLIQIEKNVP